VIDLNHFTVQIRSALDDKERLTLAISTII